MPGLYLSVGLKVSVVFSSSVLFLSVGPDGRTGDPGRKGPPGLPGRGGPSSAHSFMIARHSQSIHIPHCPNGTSLILSGYSFLFVNANERAHGQDLGESMVPYINKDVIQIQYDVFLTIPPVSQAPLEAVSLASPQCPSCSATQKATVAMLLEMTTHTGCPLTKQWLKI